MCVSGNNAYRLSTDGTNISGWPWLNFVTTSPAKVFISGRWIIVIQPDDSKKTWMPRLYVCTYRYIYIYIRIYIYIYICTLYIHVYSVYILYACIIYIYTYGHRYTRYFHAFAKAPKPCQAYPVRLTSYAQSGSISNPGWWSHASFFERNLIFWYILCIVELFVSAHYFWGVSKLANWK